jgi:hypothetical protein
MTSDEAWAKFSEKAKAKLSDRDIEDLRAMSRDDQALWIQMRADDFAETPKSIWQDFLADLHVGGQIASDLLPIAGVIGAIIAL